MEEQKKGMGALVWTIVILVIAVAAYGYWRYVKNEPSQSQTPIETPVSETPTPTPTGGTTGTSSVYKDGTYSAIGNYFSPNGAEQLAVSVTLKNDVIVDSTVVSKATFPTSKNFQTIFVNNYKTYVTGKKIQDVKLDKVSGSSLSPKGFNDALAKIEVQAKA
jgi:uncharacterized protein with FMN-binding domain